LEEKEGEPFGLAAGPANVLIGRLEKGGVALTSMF
jgi:hypothetical protein